MTPHEGTGLSPHVHNIDLTPYRGSWVLGEPHDVPGDRRTDGQRDCDRLVAVALRVTQAEPLTKQML